ncbi:MAG TPA: glycosyltransferase [Solirubrobacteraceae bacterium]
MTEAGGAAVLHVGHQRPAGRFDVAHVFNVDWPLESAHHLDLARAVADRVVLSPIHHDRRWENRYHTVGRAGLSARVARTVGLEGFLRLRGVAQAARAPRLWGEAAGQLARGVDRRQRDMLSRADQWVVLSHRETDAIVGDFGVAARPAHLVRNGADWADHDVALPALPAEFVLSVARVEARKNQLGLARALVELGVPGVFVGPANPRHRAYVRRFAAFVDEHPSLTWLGALDRYETLAMYRRARLHALASWYELLPVVDGEAAVAGCPVVTTARGYSSEVLGDGALYWDPVTGHDGLLGVLRAGLERKPDAAAAAAFRRTLSWENVRRDVALVYDVPPLPRGDVDEEPLAAASG